MALIHPTAIVEQGAQLGLDVEIGPYSIVKKDVKLANGVKLHSHVLVDGITDIGEKTEIYPFSAVGTAPQDLSYKGEDVKLFIGKSNTIRENVLINPGTMKDNGETIIGDHNLFMGSTHVAHDAILGNNIVMVNQSMVAGHVKVEDGVIIGGSTPIHQFVRLGEYCMIGGAGAVTQDIPPFCLAEGNRAVIKSLNLVGIRRKFEKSDIDALINAYKVLFRSQDPIKESIEKLMSTTDNKKVKQLCEFITTTKRGIPYERK